MLPEEVHSAFEGVDRILHAGDIGSQAVLDELGAIAPVLAVEGNTDGGWQLTPLPGRLSVMLEGQRFVLGHKLPDIVRAGIPEDAAFVIYGHTHVAAEAQAGAAVYVNPGSACHPRDGRPPSVAVIEIAGDRRTVTHVFL